ncbi:MAG: PDZ domain-containing protein, partial [Candidatus Brocadiae bacterium]|nr:PDZ domain-containing protein [Candidatus Brocadiia bacterium]
LLAVVVGLLLRQALGREDGAGAVGAAGAGDAVASSGLLKSIPTPGDPAGGTPETAPQPAGAESRVEFTLEGFLFSRAGGVYVRDVSAEEHLPRQRMWDGRSEQLRAWKESLTIPGGIQGLAAPADSNFGPLLLKGENPALAPQVRVRIRVLGPRPPEPPEEDSPRSMDTPVFPPQPAEFVEIVESEVLGPAWLEAWRELHRGVADLWAAWEMTPGAGKRTALLAAATRIGTAWEQARAARRGDRTVAWRARRESDVVSGAVEKLAQVGLDGLLPGWPSRDDLHEALMEASSPGSLRRTLLDRWGAEALRLEAWCYRSTGPGAWRWSFLPLAEVLAMSEADFARLREELHAIPNNRVEPTDAPAMAERRRAERARVAAFGLEVEALSPLDRDRYLVECGATVVSVTPGSAAERLGLRAGDVVWKTVSTWEGKGGRATGDVPVWGESGLSISLDESGALGGRILALKVLRAGELVELKIAE